MIVHDGEQTDVIFVGCDLPGDPAGWFVGEVGVVEGPVAHDQAMWRVGVEDGFVAPEGGAVG